MDAKMLDGKVAIVSGASYGMGYSMAELFAKEGAKVVMTARGKEKLDAAVQQIRDQGYDVTGVVADNKNLDDVKLKEVREVEMANKERTEDDIHECLKSLRLRTINTFNAIQKFKKNYEHYFFNKIDLEFFEEKYGYNPYYLNKLKNFLWNSFFIILLILYLIYYFQEFCFFK